MLLPEVSTGSQEGSSSRFLPSAQIAIADLVLGLVPGANLTGVEVYDMHLPFLVDGREPDSTLRTHLMPVPDAEWGEQIFASGGLWSLYRRDNRYVMPFISRRTGPKPYRLATFNNSFSEGDLYVPPWSAAVRRDLPDLGVGSVTADPLLPPIDELILIKLLSQGRGLYFHASGVTDGEGAVAFCGVSGQGKSTMARLWQGQPVVVQSDERLIVRPMDDGFWCWGTPWYSDARASSPRGAPLRKLYFIEHGPVNRILPVSAAEAARRLLVTCFPTYYDADGMESTLALVSRLCTEVSCAVLSFVPDERVVDLVWHDSLKA